MEQTNRYCVIMCGGVGSRFWPYSRASRPKQFIDILGIGRSLLQLTVDRLAGIVPPENIYLLTNAQYASLIAEQLPGVDPAHILLEPARRNTAPCIAWAAWHIHKLNPQASIMVAPSDHLIIRQDEFRHCALRAFDFVESNDALVTFGIKPSRPETGYGYIQEGDRIDDWFARVKTFTEKPNLELARVFVESGEFYWNSGMFFWRAGVIKDAMRSHAPQVAEVFDRGEGVYGTPQEQQFIDENYPTCPNISIDYAVMEHSSRVYVERVDLGWSDLGTWGSLFENVPKNDLGNVAYGSRSLAYESHGNVVTVQDPEKLVVVAGLNDFIVADTPDALLIVPKADEQKIKNYVNDVRAKFGDKYL